MRPRSKRPQSLVEVTALKKSFGRRLVLTGLSFTAGAGEIVIVTGPSGCGKTTLLRLLHGELRADRGRVWVDGRPLHRRWLRGVESLRRESGFIFQDHRLLPRLNAVENVTFGLQVAHPEIPYSAIRKASLEALDAVGLADVARHFPHQLSTGERQRVAVARALAARPRLVLADEPTAALDPSAAGLVWGALREAAAGGALVVVALHDVEVASSRVISLPRLSLNGHLGKRR